MLKTRTLRALIVLSLLVFLPEAKAQQLAVPADAGSTVNGFQDDFDGSTLAPVWAPSGASGIYSVANGVLHVTTTTGDPNHLLYTVPGYDSTVQEILVRIRFTSFGTGDQARGGVALGVEPNSSQGINYHFRDVSGEGQVGRHTSFLDDLRAWGPGYAFTWQNNVWYWVRLRQEPNAASLGGAMDIFAKVWLADGSVPEPTQWQSWDYIPSRTARTGFAGITAGSSGGTSVFDVDYVLIKAAGLPAITVAPKAFPLYTAGPVTITSQPKAVTALQCQSSKFDVTVDGTPPYSFQWLRNGVLIPNATNASYTIDSVAAADNAAAFTVRARNTVSGSVREVTSNPATLTVTPDSTPPALVSASNVGLDRLLLTFSEPVTAASATNLANFTITSAGGALPVRGASLQPGGDSVLLVTAGQTEGTSYELVVNNIADQCTGANLIAPNSTTRFTALSYTPAGIGAASGALGPVPGGYDASATGKGTDGAADQAQFGHQSRTGDFDFAVRLESVRADDPWAEAGLMVRETLQPGSRVAAVLATPSVSGAFFKARPVENSNVAVSGSYSVNYPNTWLRLRRVGSQFTGYASLDGQRWTVLGSASIAMPATIYFGFTAASHDPSQTVRAAFRDLGTPAGSTVAPDNRNVEPLGQSSRKTSLVISEIMYHPANVAGLTNSLEFVELFNTLGTPEDLSGYRLDGDVHFTFPEGTFLPGGSFLVVARSPVDLQSQAGITGVLGPFTGNLPNDSGTVQLRSPAGAIFLEVNYGSKAPWPVSPDGAGHSLVLARPSYGENSPKAWHASDSIGGSPGRLDPVTTDPLRSVVINEVLAHTSSTTPDFIELFNRSNAQVDLSGCFLSDDPDTNKFVIPPGTLLPARGFISFDQAKLGFSLHAGGETVFFRNAANTRVIDAVKFGAQIDGLSFGRYPDGGERMRILQSATPGASNARFLRSDIVINELMFDPISGQDADQYIELYNRSGSPVDLTGWRFVEGVDFTFPTNSVMKPRAYLVVAKHAAHLQTNYPGLSSETLVGNFSGSLSKRGERLALARPESVVTTNTQGILATNIIFPVIHELSYGSDAGWGEWSHGGGSSLELIDPESDNSFAMNWVDSIETAKAPWTTLRVTGTVDNGSTAADQLQVLLQGAGECLIDDVQVLNASGANFIANSSFESGATGWTAEGTEQSSGLENSEGFNSAKSYRIRAVDRGDNQVNRVRVPLTSALAANTTATIQAKVRWLRGHPQLLFRIRGNWLEAPCEMALPSNLGTPGQRNSRAASNAGPAIAEVIHQPILPADKERVVVTARVDDRNGVSTVSLKYRLDPATSFSSVPMRDDGVDPDQVSGDGVYAGAIPGQAAGTLVAFYVAANDSAQPSASSLYPSDAPNRECLVRFGESAPTGNFPVYRLWMTQQTLNTWANRSKLDNSPLNITFVLGSQRVVYNTLALYAGSPYIAPGYCGPSCGHCGYSISFPEGEPFLGGTDLVLDWPGGHGGENTAIQEQMAYWIAQKMGLPYSHRYFIHLHVNGVTDDQRGTIFEAVNQPAGEFIDAWSPKANKGDFYKVDRGFEFSDGGGLIADPMPTLQVFTTTGGKKKAARYRWNWNKRSANDYNNYTNIFELVDAVNAAAPQPYTSATENLVDVDEWMGIFAAEHIINNFDSWGHLIGKNMYAYKPDDGKWQLYMFDLDWLMLVSTRGPGNYTASTGPLFVSNDPVVGRMFDHPPFRRAYFRAVLAAVNGPLQSANADPVMDAKYESLLANRVAYCDGQPLGNPSELKRWFSDRRVFLQSQLATVAANFNVAGNRVITSTTNVVTLTGTAPVSVKNIEVNGLDWPITWTTVTNWALTVPLPRATNLLELVALDQNDVPLANGTNNITVLYNGALRAKPSIVINEWMADNTATVADLSSGLARFDDWFELYNAGEFPVDLSGYYLTDTTANKLQFKIPTGHSIAPGGFLLAWADNEPEQNTAGSASLHVNFALSAKGESIGLYTPEGEEVDLVNFGPMLPDIAGGRCPDGSTNIIALQSATPGSANNCVVTQPQFQTLSRSVDTLTFTWHAEAGVNYTLEFTDDLAAPWLPASAQPAGAGGSVSVSTTEAAHRFYRLRTAP